MRKIIALIILSVIVNRGDCQFFGTNYYNNLQYNAAWCGQDGKNTIQAGGFFDVSGHQYYGKGYSRPQYYQAAYAADIEKIHSGAGVFVTYLTAGFDRQTTASGIYNFHVKINEHSDFRIGTQLDLAFRKEEPHYFYGYQLSANNTNTSVLLDPGLWYRNAGLNFGFSVKNVTADEMYERDFYFTMFNDSIGDKSFRLIPVVNFNIYSYHGDNVNEINPQLNMEIANAAIFNGGWAHLFGNGGSGNYFTAGIGFIINKKTRFLFNYTHISDSEISYLSGFLKIGF